jgi:hypothetical protein
MKMTQKRVEELLKYYEASRGVLETSYKNYPEKFNKISTEIALNLFDDTISVIKYINSNPSIISEIDQITVKEEEISNEN